MTLGDCQHPKIHILGIKSKLPHTLCICVYFILYFQQQCSSHEQNNSGKFGILPIFKLHLRFHAIYWIILVCMHFELVHNQFLWFSLINSEICIWVSKNLQSFRTIQNTACKSMQKNSSKQVDNTFLFNIVIFSVGIPYRCKTRS